VLHSAELPRSIEPTADWGYDAADAPLDLTRRPTALVAFNGKAPAAKVPTRRHHGRAVAYSSSITRSPCRG
jgi:LacI family transcriptional regulator